MPGYTGHVRRAIQFQQPQAVKPQPRSQIPGYCGFIPGVKAENLYGSTYGTTTNVSAMGEFHRGLDLPNYVKY